MASHGRLAVASESRTLAVDALSTRPASSTSRANRSRSGPLTKPSARSVFTATSGWRTTVPVGPAALAASASRRAR